MVPTSWNLSPVLMRKSSEPEVVERSGAVISVQPGKPQTVAPEAQAKLQEISKRRRRLGNSGTAPFGPPNLNPFQHTAQRAKVVGETTAETGSLLSASIESICADGNGSNNNKNSNNNKPNSMVEIVDHGGTKPVSGDLSGFQYHILAVDDSLIDQMVIEKLLKISAYKVTTVNSGLRALEILGLSESPGSSFKKVDIDLIMTDYCMPEMSGYDLLKRVKAKTSALKEIPVVVMSSENDSNRIKRCLAEGAKEFIIKPIQMADVKRLWGHIRSTRPTSSSKTTRESSSSSTCGKRKVTDCLELHEVSSPERWPSL